MQYTEEQIQEIQHELETEYKKEDSFLKEIEHLSESIAARLVKNGHTRENFMDTEFVFNLSYNSVNKTITVMRTDIWKFKLGMGHYKPAFACGEWNDTMTLEENVMAVVKASLCSKAGIINIEEV